MNSSNVIPCKTGYAILQNGVVNFIGSGFRIENTTDVTTSINDVLDVQSSYVSPPYNNFGNTLFDEPLVIIKNNLSVTVISIFSYPTSRGNLQSNYSPIDNGGNSLINTDLVNYDYVLNNVTQRNNKVFGCLKGDYYYLKHDNTNYKLFQK